MSLNDNLLQHSRQERHEYSPAIESVAFSAAEKMSLLLQEMFAIAQASPWYRKGDATVTLPA